MKLTDQSMTAFLNDLASSSPAPGGGSVAALSGAIGSALISMVCSLTIGKKKYQSVDAEMKKVLKQSEDLRSSFNALVDEDTQAFTKVMEAYALPKETDDQKALRAAAVQEATKEAALVPLRVMKHVIDALALAKVVAEKGNVSSISDTGVGTLMLHAAAEGAALNVRINLNAITDPEFVGWHSEEVNSLQRTSKLEAEEIINLVNEKTVH